MVCQIICFMKLNFCIVYLRSYDPKCLSARKTFKMVLSRFGMAYPKRHWLIQYPDSCFLSLLWESVFWPSFVLPASRNKRWHCDLSTWLVLQGQRLAWLVSVKHSPDTTYWFIKKTKTSYTSVIPLRKALSVLSLSQGWLTELFILLGHSQASWPWRICFQFLEPNKPQFVVL